MSVQPWSSWHRCEDWMAAADRVLRDEATALVAAGEALRGRCSLCREDVAFDGDPRSGATREGMACANCGCTARQRAVAIVLFDALSQPMQSVVYTTEHASSFYVWLRRRVGRLLGSEYGIGLRRRLRMSAWLWRSRVAELVRLQDVTALSFRDSSLDAVVCQDVLEHVPDYRAALREFARVLKAGATLVATVPFYDRAPASVQIAFPDGRGGVEHAGEPEYHGDPVGGGVLCYHHFGWDLLGAMREAGFADAIACRVHGIEHGLPQGLWVLRARR